MGADNLGKETWYVRTYVIASLTQLVDVQHYGRIRRPFWLESKTCTYVRMYTLLLGGGGEYVRTYIKPVQDLRTYVR